MAAGNIDQHEQFIASLPPQLAQQVVQRFYATDDCEQEFNCLVTTVGHYKPSAVAAAAVLHNADELASLQRSSEGTLAVVQSRKRKYDCSQATVGAAAADWNNGGKLRPSGTQRRKALQKDRIKARQSVADRTVVRDYFT